MHSSPRRFGALCLLGFACFQAYFLCSVLYVPASGGAGPLGPWYRSAIMMVFSFVIGSGILIPLERRLSGRARRPLVIGAGCLGLLGSLSVFIPGGLAALEVARCLVSGFACAVLLAEWGALLVSHPMDRSTAELFLGCALAAALSLLAGSLPWQAAFVLQALFAPCSAWMLCRLHTAEPLQPHRSEGGGAADRRSAKLLLAGAAMYGASAGLCAPWGSVQGPSSEPMAAAVLVYTLFCLGALQLYGGLPLRLAGIGIAPTGEERMRGRALGPLDGAYRLACMLSVGGFALIPLMAWAGLPDSTVVIAGMLAMETVFTALFILAGSLRRLNPVRSLLSGCAVMLSAFALATLLAMGMRMGQAAGTSALCAAAGAVISLYAYLFVFPAEDLAALTVEVRRSGGLHAVCAAMTTRFSLSGRESEVLALALRGRTGERMAEELVISKNTVETHMRRIYRKCGVSNKQELIDLAQTMEDYAVPDEERGSRGR